jgi:hypothetical protein
MNQQEKRKLTLVVADVFASEPDARINDIAKRLGYTPWEIRMACYRGNIPLKVGRRPKSKVS